MYNSDGTGEYLGAAPGGETIPIIRGCAIAITDRYREIYGKVPENFTLESIWFAEQTTVEHTHEIWGYPQIKENRKLHGFLENGTYWLYGRIYDILAFIKSL